MSDTTEDRETALLEWTTNKCNTMEPIDLEEGWEKIKDCGIDVLEYVLKSGSQKKATASEIKLDHNQNKADKAVKEMQMKRMVRPFGSKGYSSLYTISYRMCSHAGNMDWSEQLYQRYGETIREFLTSHVLSTLEDQHDEYLLQAFNNAWCNHKIMVTWMFRLFMHLDRGVVQNNNLATLTSVGLKLFKEVVFDQTSGRLRGAVVELLNRERGGEDVDRDLLRATVGAFLAMGVAEARRNLAKVEDAETRSEEVAVYEAQLEGALLGAAREYYARQGAQWLEGDSVPGYLLKAEQALADEAARSRRYCHPATEAKVALVLEEELLARHLDNLLAREQSGMAALLQQDRRQDLDRMARLFGRLERGLPAMAEIFREHVKAQGYALIQDRKAQIVKLQSEGKKETAQDPELVQGILDLYDNMKKIVESLFGDGVVFHKALKDAFGDFVNADAGRHSVTEMLCAYCDRLLKNSQKMSEQQVEEALTMCMKVFVYVTDKDMFAEIYRDHLAKRLLNKRSFSNEAEKAMISKMKMQCGAPFTAKLEGMVIDFNVGEDLHKEFAEHFAKVKGEQQLRLDFGVTVLTTGFWPAQKTREAALPREMAACAKAFADWYGNKNHMRRLAWVPALGEATVAARFGKKKYDVVLTTLQAVALLRFDGRDGARPLPFEEFRQDLNLDLEVAKKVLHSLSCGRYKVLSKSSPGGSKILDTDAFSPNPGFNNKLRKFRVPMASLEEANYQRAVAEDRVFAVEAAVVRVMKARRQLRHAELVNEVVHQLRNFQPNSRSIKQRIEALIEREYLERSEEDAQIYRYLA